MAHDWWWRTMLAVGVVLVQIQLVRALYPPGYALVGDLGFVVTPVVLLAVFLGPLLALLVAGRTGPTAWWLAVTVLVGARLAIQAAAPPLWLAAPAASLGLAGATVILARLLAQPTDRSTVAVGAVGAIAADVVIMGGFAGLDLVWWRTGLGGALALVLVVALLALIVVAARRIGAPSANCEIDGSGRVLAALALLAMPWTTMTASVAYIGSSAAWSLVPVVAALGAGGALAVLAASTACRRGTEMVMVVAGVLAASILWVLPAVGGVVVILVAVVALVASAIVVGGAVASAGPAVHQGLRRSAIGATCGWMAMFVLTLLVPMHYELPLPFGNRILAPIAMIAATLVAVRARRVSDPEPAPDAPDRSAARAAGALAAVAALAALVLVVGRAEERTAAASASVSVASFNIDQALTATGAVDFAAVERIIEDLDADIVALQEVGRGWALSGMNDFVAWYRQRHGERIFFASAADDQFGNLLISRVDLADVHRVELPQGGGSMGRSAIVATVATPEGALTVIAVHLQHRNSETAIAARDAELQVVLDTWAGSPATVILGDFNANNQRPSDGGAKVLEGPGQANTLRPLLDAGFVTTQPTVVCTEPTSNDNCSDFIFVTPDLDLGDGVVVLEEQEVGDHRPIRATITISS